MSRRSFLGLAACLGVSLTGFVGAAQNREGPSDSASAFQAFRAGDYAQAITLYESALREAGAKAQSCEEMLPMRQNLSILYAGLQRYEEAERILWKGKEDECPGNTLSESNLVSQSLALGEVYRSEHKYQESQREFQWALETAERLYGREHRQVALVLTNWGQLYLDQYQISSAEPILERAKTILLQSSVWDQHLASALNHLAECYLLEKQYARAQPLLVRSLSIYEQELGPDHPYLAAPLSNLALIYNRDQQFALAESALQRALSLTEKSLGAGHPQVAQILDILAASYWGQKEVDKAERCLRRAVSLAQQSTVSALDRIRYSHDLADLDAARHSYGEAEQLYRACLRSLSRRECDFPLRKEILHDLAALLRATHRASEARQLAPCTLPDQP